MSDDDEVGARRRAALGLGGPDAIAREHARGRLTVRERIDRLVDAGSFREIGTMTTLPITDVHGTVTAVVPAPYVGGFATIDGRPVVVGGEDFTINYGAPAQHLEKFKGGFSGYIEELAIEHRLPLVLLLHGAGGDVGFADAVGFTAVPSAHSVYPMAELLDVVPVVTAVLGVVGGGAGARAVASHFSVMSRPQGMMFAAGPAIVERALGRPVDKAALGGVEVHVTASGNVENIAEDEDDALDQIRRFLAFLPSNVDELPPAMPAGVPGDGVEGLVDEGTWFPIGATHGTALTVGLGRIGGRGVGVLVHDGRPADALAADKQTRFVQLCDTFHLPMVFLVDTPGVVGDEASEADGVLRRWVRATQVMHRVRVPVLSVQTGACDGLSGWATNGPNRTALRVAWPSATFGPSGEGPWATAEHLGVEEVIRPEETRDFVSSWLDLTSRANRPGPRPGPQYRP